MNASLVIISCVTLLLLAIMQAMKPGIVSILKAETLAKIQEKPDETTQEIQNTNRYQKTNGRRLKRKN